MFSYHHVAVFNRQVVGIERFITVVCRFVSESSCHHCMPCFLITGGKLMVSILQKEVFIESCIECDKL